MQREEQMAKKPTASDAELIVKLYDLRREPEMRKARQWWLVTFWPASADEYLKVDREFGSQENNWLRQVISYWGMAASLVLHGTLHEKVFLEPAFSGEMYFLFAKVRPFLKELREKTKNPHLLGNIEKVITGSKIGRERLANVERMIAARRARG
jgi:hypothetical protein